ncbi:MAG: hypothetical protein QOG15_1123 [Solirubrobacteraceae bacterium]|nr:hypothetical protein [Solirubrobacteraceae bacterium]
MSEVPELHFTVRWPDGSLERCYSPSHTVRDYLAPGETYPLPDFLRRTTSALEHASDRVRGRYGFACSSAAQQLEAIERSAAAFDEHDDAQVTVLGFDE